MRIGTNRFSMGAGRSFLAGIISLVLAGIALVCIDRFGPGNHTREFYFGNIKNVDELERLLHQSYLKGVRNILLLIFLFAVMYMIFFVLIFEAASIGYYLLTSKWGKPPVFISYKNTEAGASMDTRKIALELKAGLEQRGFRIHFFDYTGTLHHDQINDDILALQRKAKVLIVVPDAYKPSYVNAEISNAVYDRKPVFIVRHTVDQKLPDTANSGHTVLRWNKLKADRYKALAYLLRYVHNNWYTRFFILLMPLVSLLYFISFFEDKQEYLIGSILGSGLLLVILLQVHAPLDAVLIGVKVLVGLLGAAVAFVTQYYIFQRIYLQKVIRQSVLSGGDTYKLFADAGFSKSVLAILDKKGLVIAD